MVGMWVSRACWSKAAHEDVVVLMELGAAGLFCERVGDVVGSADVSEDDLFVFYPLEDCELFEFNMAGAAGGLLGVCHEAGAIVVLVDDGG